MLAVETTIQPPRTLIAFCQAVIARCGQKWPPDEGLIAHEFVEFFRVGGYLRLEDLERLCRELEIEFSRRLLPRELRGHNYAYGDKRGIVVRIVTGEAAISGVHEHSALHELRELIEYEFRSLGRPVATSSDLESRAELFAGTVRGFAYVTALKPIAEEIGDIETTWIKIGIMVPVVLLGLAAGVLCVTLPSREDRLTE